MKETVRSWIFDIVAFVIGTAMVAAGLVLFTIPNDIAPGGVSGLATALAFLAPVSVGVWTLLLIVDATVVVFAVLVFRNIEVALYSIVTIFVTTRTIDAIMQGVDHAKVIYIVTERSDDILSLLAEELGRGVTVLQGRGGYTRRDKHVLMLVVRRSSFAQTLKAIKQIDRQAFIFVTDATEVHGEGFKSME